MARMSTLDPESECLSITPFARNTENNPRSNGLVFPVGYHLCLIPNLDPTPLEGIDQLRYQECVLARSSIWHVTADHTSVQGPFS